MGQNYGQVVAIDLRLTDGSYPLPLPLSTLNSPHPWWLACDVTQIFFSPIDLNPLQSHPSLAKSAVHTQSWYQWVKGVPIKAQVDYLDSTHNFLPSSVLFLPVMKMDVPVQWWVTFFPLLIPGDKGSEVPSWQL